jgi:hypothetical protein
MFSTVWPWKPSAVAVTVYGPPVTRLRALKRPSSFAMMSVVAPVRVSVTVTRAFGTGAPASLVT